MTKVSTFYDTFRAAIPVVLGSGYSEIPNVYFLESNPELLLRVGWGIRFGGGSAVSGVLKETTDDQTWDVVLTRKVARLDSQVKPYVDETKNILEDALKLKKDMMNPDQLGIESSVWKIDYLTTSDIQFIQGDKFDIIFTAVSFSVTISEDI